MEQFGGHGTQLVELSLSIRKVCRGGQLARSDPSAITHINWTRIERMQQL
jgi:hypothetical protein